MGQIYCIMHTSIIHTIRQYVMYVYIPLCWFSILISNYRILYDILKDKYMIIDVYVCRNQKLLHYTVIAMPHSVSSLRPAPNDIVLVLCFLSDQKKWCGVVGQGSVYMMCVRVSNVRRYLLMVSVVFFHLNMIICLMGCWVSNFSPTIAINAMDPLPLCSTGLQASNWKVEGYHPLGPPGHPKRHQSFGIFNKLEIWSWDIWCVISRNLWWGVFFATAFSLRKDF